MAIAFWFAFFLKIPPKSLSVLVDDFEGRILFEIGFQTKIDQQEGQIEFLQRKEIFSVFFLTILGRDLGSGVDTKFGQFCQWKLLFWPKQPK